MERILNFNKSEVKWNCLKYFLANGAEGRRFSTSIQTANGEDFAVACYLYFTICASKYVLVVVLTTTIHEINKQGKHKLSVFKAVKIVNEGNFTP